MTLNLLLRKLGAWTWDALVNDGLMASHIWGTPIPYGLNVSSNSTCPVPPPIGHPVSYPFNNNTARRLLVQTAIQRLLARLDDVVWQLRYISTMWHIMETLAGGGDLTPFLMRAWGESVASTVLRRALGLGPLDLRVHMVMEGVFLHLSLSFLLLVNFVFVRWRRRVRQGLENEGGRGRWR
ncbi:hypothetical protein SODALDRAFT_184246 [Sodiomyces alkalinus F11]|uniref:Uncharacterized protein n=1 Tax=Sodiomyces alkalinus (strain CBS 110278 / VKM F-3762 / F11) TaxID=1314773 RepID=A0A3N2PV58_SODAK|nr:hypothetical protein SODALDRAFT_184246 [Sodiomyces alkalinus F11]ROT38226.1 hypothetical protein SODALDRAFT_184246 [Sodiomyces alkalinus F11]